MTDTQTHIKTMNYEEYLESFRDPAPPPELDPWLTALWHARQGDWERAHRIVQALPDRKAARIHAYLHRVEGDHWNSRYWHERAGARFPEHLSLEEEWERRLVHLALESRGRKAAEAELSLEIRHNDRFFTGGGECRRAEAMNPIVGVIMGSSSDWETMRHAAETLAELGIPFEKEVVSAHRTPDKLYRYASEARERGLEVIIAGAGGAAHLPGMVAAKTCVPVLGVPVQSKALNGMDSLLSIVQMPAGIPVGTLAIGRAGAVNAALLAAAMLGSHHAEIRKALEAWRERQTEAVLANPDPAAGS